MPTLVGSVREVDTSHGSAVGSSTPLKSRWADMWPPTIVAIGVGLSLLWTASLFWLLYEIV
jgi:hypothetical protein